MNYPTYMDFEVYNSSKLRVLLNKVKILVSFSFKPYIRVGSVYMPYAQYKRNIDFYECMDWQQRTRQTNINNMPSVGCSQ